MELDELIGEIRREAARRRAAPDFPLSEEAALDAALDRLGPVGGAADLAAITARLRRLAATADPLGASDGAPPAPVGTRASTPVAGYAELADLAASAVNALGARLDHLERRVGRRPHPSRPAPVAAVGGRPFDPALAEAAAAHLEGSGPVLIAGTGAAAWVEALATLGIAGYGVDPSIGEFEESGLTRSGPVLEHLRSVGSDELDGALLVGPLGSAEVIRLEEWAEELARVTARVAVWSEAPWSWQVRLGDVGADRAERRPISPETWLATLSRAGWPTTGSYGPDGTDFLLLAARRP